jgi:hypothetical protein
MWCHHNRGYAPEHHPKVLIQYLGIINAHAHSSRKGTVAPEQLQVNMSSKPLKVFQVTPGHHHSSFGLPQATRLEERAQ